MWNLQNSIIWGFFEVYDDTNVRKDSIIFGCAKKINKINKYFFHKVQRTLVLQKYITNLILKTLSQHLVVI